MDIGVALLGNAVAIGTVFAPWAQYQTKGERVEQLGGTSTDANVLIASSAIAIVSIVCALVLSNGSAASMIGFVASVVSFVVAGATWMLINSVYVGDPDISSLPTADWGAIAGTLGALLASVFAFRVMCAVRLYD